LLEAFGGMKGAGNLDFVTAWYVKAAKYIQGTKIKMGFVSTNSIAQGEQVGLLWKYLKDFNIVIHFAHQTFKWTNDAAGVAAVYCVIIGFGAFEIEKKWLYEYEDIRGEDKEREVKHINPYLVEGQDVLIENRGKSICKAPTIKFGNQPIDGGNLLFTKIEMEKFISEEPEIKKYIRRYYGSDEFINNIERYCFWLYQADPSDLKKSKIILERLEKVREFRLSSTRKETRELAEFPSLFAFVSHEESEYIIIPGVSSEKREYIPMGFMPKDVIASNACLIIPNATLYHFGVLQSEMHMVWVRYVCGRLKSDYRYSNNIVYNNFPWPKNVSAEKQKKVEDCAEYLLAARTTFPNSSLADLYDPSTMPPDLRTAHNNLDKAVEACYGRKFKDDQERIAYLFELYKEWLSSS
jgi:hypothetical protein